MTTYTTQGLIATTPKHFIAIGADGVETHTITFRMASGSHEYNKTNWFTVTAHGHLAVSASTSLAKGDRIVVCGELNVRDWNNEGTEITTVEIIASSMGHDLAWGTSVFTRTVLNQNQPLSTLESQVTPKPKHECNCGKCEKRN